MLFNLHSQHSLVEHVSFSVQAGYADDGHTTGMSPMKVFTTKVYSRMVIFFVCLIEQYIFYRKKTPST